MGRLINTSDLHNIVMKEKSEYGRFSTMIDNIVEGMVMQVPTVKFTNDVQISEGATNEKIYEDIEHAINVYIAYTQKKPYIFMNEELAHNLMDANNWYLKVEYQKQYPGEAYMPLAEFHGCKVYLDPDLDYGKIELR